jgi:methionine--tRNA ligase beta chain
VIPFIGDNTYILICGRKVDSFETPLRVRIAGGIQVTEFKVASVKVAVSPEVLEKLDIRVGTIVSVQDVQGSDKLVQLKVDFGDCERNVIVGMKKERENPKEIEGRQALFVVNVEPRKMMGQVSEAMLFDIGYADGIVPVLAVPEKPVPNGARAG